MSKIRGKDTKIEVLVRKWLFSHGFRFRKNDNRYPGSPDIVLPKYKTVIFIHGCFWHHHSECRGDKLPQTRTEFWKTKFQRNIVRDEAKVRELEAEGWKVIVLWECELKKNPYLILNQLIMYLRGVGLSNMCYTISKKYSSVSLGVFQPNVRIGNLLYFQLCM